MSKIVQARRDTFLADGFVVARGILDRAALNSINGEIADLFAVQLRRLGLPVDRGGSREAFRGNAVRLLRADVRGGLGNLDGGISGFSA